MAGPRPAHRLLATRRPDSRQLTGLLGIGALLAEWLATGTGLGHQMLKDAFTFAYTHLRSSVVVLPVVLVVLDYLVGAVESVVTTRFGVVTRR